ncbi:MAG: hypothetical protein AAGI88_14205 [Pseudomonadota bacterium]
MMPTDIKYVEEGQEGRSLREHLAMLKRRLVWLLAPAIGVFLLALLLAFALPASYQSVATILIERQAIPQDFVRSTISNFAAEQVQIVSQRVLTVDNINGIVEKFELYQDPDSTSRSPRTELARRFRDKMDLQLVSADVIDPRSGRPTEATIAFTLSFTADGPSTSQKVTNELVTLFLNENLRDRTDQAVSTAEFLDSEAQRLNAELVLKEVELAAFKSENEGSLPELYQFNLATLERTQREISDARLRNQELEKRRIELESQIAPLSPSAAVVMPNGEVVLSDTDLLKTLQSELRRKSAIYRDTHPDIIRLKREISTLNSELRVGIDPRAIARELRAAEDLLLQLQQRYSDSHAEVVEARRFVDEVRSELRAAQRGELVPGPSEVADNPAYVVLQTQISAIDSEKDALEFRVAELQQKILRYEALLKRAPNVEKEYQGMLRDYENATLKYQEIRAKQREAAVARNLEQEQKGERFVLIEPPELPVDPVSPNRPAIILVGFVLAVGLGLGAALLREAFDGALHGVREFTRSMGGEAPLVVIPYLEHSGEVAARTRTFSISATAALTSVLLLCVSVHLFVKPLDVLFYMALNKVGIG